MKSKFLPITVVLFFVALLMTEQSCKKDDKWIGCVYGKFQYRGGAYYIGCMSRTEFKAYLDSPTARAIDPQAGPLLDKEITWQTVKDCSKCEQ